MVRVRPRCPALPVAEEAGHKRVQRSKFCERKANRKFRAPQTGAGMHLLSGELLPVPGSTGTTPLFSLQKKM